MEDYEGFETVRQKLILSGIKEIEDHGITDFSLRRVASSCNVSCAAPYKHFKSKEHFISEIISYINEQWLMLEKQVSSIFSNDVKTLIVETCIAYIKFWIANPNFRSVLMIKTTTDNGQKKSDVSILTDSIKGLIQKYCAQSGISSDIEQQKIYIIRSLVYGATIMLDNAEIENSAQTMDMIRKSILSQL